MKFRSELFPVFPLRYFWDERAPVPMLQN